MKVIISGGGTGGHVFPAIAIANALKSIDPTVDILFIGAKGKLEMEKVPKAGYPIEGLWISGFHRKSISKNLLFIPKLLSSLFKANRLVAQFKPDVVVGVGGYASGPTLEVATRRKIPTLIQEQNSFPGKTNILLSKKVDTICVAYDKMERFFPADKIVLTGNPVRKDLNLSNSTPGKARLHFGLDASKKTLFVFGGSLGAKTINEAMAANTSLLKQQPDIQVLWQAGKLYIEDFKNCATAQLSNVVITDFIDDMNAAYTAADIVVGRAGALSIAELCLVGKPCILVPSPNVAEDHQTKNAMALVEKNAALLVKDSEAKNEMLVQALKVLANAEKCQQLKHNIMQLAKPNSATSIAKIILDLGKNK